MFEMRVDSGSYVKDVVYKNLSPSRKRELWNEAEHIFYKTNLDIKRVEVDGKKVWRFVDRK